MQKWHKLTHKKAFRCYTRRLYGHQLVKNLPVNFLQHTLDYDELYDITDKGSLSFLLEKINEPGNFIPARTDGVNVHVMNKYSLVRQSKKIVEMYK